jgi:phage gpG-like protein
MAGLTFKVNDKGAAAKLNALAKLTGNLQPAFAVIGARIATRIRLCFKLGIDPWSNPWKALKFRKGQPLRDTGRLQRSITSNPDATGVTIGTNVRYARTHQFGATIVPVKAKRLVFPGPNGRLIFAKKVTIPARPFMPIQPGQEVAVLPPAWSVEVVRGLKAYFAKQLKPTQAKA